MHLPLSSSPPHLPNPRPGHSENTTTARSLEIRDSRPAQGWVTSTALDKPHSRPGPSTPIQRRDMYPTKDQIYSTL